MLHLLKLSPRPQLSTPFCEIVSSERGRGPVLPTLNCFDSLGSIVVVPGTKMTYMYHLKNLNMVRMGTYITTKPSLLCPLRLKFLQELQTTHITTSNFFLGRMDIMVQSYGLPSEFPFLVSPACPSTLLHLVQICSFLVQSTHSN